MAIANNISQKEKKNHIYITSQSLSMFCLKPEN